MGLVFRKTKKVGPFRVSVSKKGVGVSAGVPGYRVTKRADGRVQETVSLPGSGIRYTTSTPAKRKAVKRKADDDYAGHDHVAHLAVQEIRAERAAREQARREALAERKAERRAARQKTRAERTERAEARKAADAARHSAEAERKARAMPYPEAMEIAKQRYEAQTGKPENKWRVRDHWKLGSLAQKISQGYA